ncbi:hypothetical protein [Thermoflavimicrobium daqui]|uniref:hypothetical protein n=1 Tax=Thermoflavimicrobium daqui TaxID=2137476 RepID=UPI00143D4A64|nr:hypothetical protein [Thermoflavimicrobium daqui]
MIWRKREKEEEKEVKNYDECPNCGYKHIYRVGNLAECERCKNKWEEYTGWI